MIKLIHKKGAVERIENYRGITLMDTGYKIYTERLRGTLEKEMTEEEVLNRTQFGFRKEKGTIEAIYVLSEIIEENVRKEKGKIQVCFADLKAAFDKLNRKMI